MNILHAHYSPEEPGLTFWTETADVAAPKSRRGRAAENPYPDGHKKPRAHPFSLPPDELALSSSKGGEKRKFALQLPSVRGIPLPSPQLVHNWDMDAKNPALIPFLVNGIFLPFEKQR